MSGKEALKVILETAIREAKAHVEFLQTTIQTLETVLVDAVIDEASPSSETSSLAMELEESLEDVKKKKQLSLFAGNGVTHQNVVNLADAREARDAGREGASILTPAFHDHLLKMASPSTLAFLTSAVPSSIGPMPVAPGMSSEVLRQKQNRLVQLIDEHEEELAESIATMGCRGDCYKCPHPNYSSVELQVDACLSSVLAGLGLDP